MINSRDVNLLHPALQRAVAELIQRMKIKGYPVLITSTYRDNEYQNYLYAQGRTAKGNIVTYAKGGQSIHNYKLAFDICKNIKGQEFNDKNFFATAGVIGKDLGLVWGGNFKGLVDTPHFEFTNGLTLTQLQQGNKVPEDIKLKWEKALTADNLIYKIEQKISLDKAYWKKALDGHEKINPIYLKIIINRLLGKGETGVAISTDNVLNNIKNYVASLDYWRDVLDGKIVANVEYVRLLLGRMV